MATEPAKPTAGTDRQADLVCLADIEHRPVEWLWQDRLASGTLVMLSGDPGSGKTWVASAIFAHGVGVEAAGALRLLLVPNFPPCSLIS